MSDLAMEQKQKSKPALKSCVTIGAHTKLKINDAQKLARQNIPVTLHAESYAKMKDSYRLLKSYVDQRLPIYGINTNFGDQVRYIDSHLKNGDALSYNESIRSRQKNIIKSLSCGLGTIIPPEIIKITMMLRAHCLAQGYSGVSIEAVETILLFLNAGIAPIVRCYGSIGASGDLIPLSMISAALIGENVDVLYKNKIMKAPRAIEMAGLSKLTPQLRDGLALINGTSFMTAIASLTLFNLKRLFFQMLSAIAMSLESMLVINSAYHPLVHQLKQQSGKSEVNLFLVNFWQDSQLVSDLEEIRKKNKAYDLTKTTTIQPVQDYYSLRAVPQGFGPFYENLERATSWIENEMNSVNDNPIIDAVSQKIHHNANFMGYYITDACDMLKMNIGQASTWIHALLANMVHPRKNHDLPANIVPDPGKNNGFRSMQLLAAALAVQNRKLAQAHQSFTLPTEGDNQDVNSLGTHAALDFKESVANLERLTAILLLASTQALELRGISKASSSAVRIYQIIRECSSPLIECRPMTEEIESVINLLQEEKF